jgi:hypothetical protein
VYSREDSQGCVVLPAASFSVVVRDVSGTAQFLGDPTFSRDWIAGVPHRWHNRKGLTGHIRWGYLTTEGVSLRHCHPLRFLTAAAALTQETTVGIQARRFA